MERIYLGNNFNSRDLGTDAMVGKMVQDGAQLFG